ncbi:MAG: hypothetical protein HYZ81_12580 [Nitrospinae bacterium]|nr:hypothetical protein [Nitrospinota bacterium]
MMEALACDHLVQALHQQLAFRPDDRTGKHTPYAINDAARGACAVFFPQSPSLLADQRRMDQAKGRSNADSLCGSEASSCDKPLRTLRDPVAPAQLFPVCEGISGALERAGHVAACRTFAGQLLMAWDGTEYFASQEMQCARCAQRTHAQGHVTEVHQAMSPGMVAPGRHEVIPVEPACITPPDGHVRQDCEQVAARRWIARQAGRYRWVTL